MTYYSCKVVIFLFVTAAGVVTPATTGDADVKSFGCNTKTIPAGEGYYGDYINEAVKRLAKCTNTGGQIGNCEVKVPDSENPRIIGHGQCTVSSKTKANCRNCLLAAGRYLVSNCRFTEADVIYNHCSMSYNSRGL
ncbi:hypothetical protein LINPERPRIM_LOCUS14035 [Linum perenne]